MSANTRWRKTAAVLTVVGTGLFGATAALDAAAQGVTRGHLEAQGWTCFTPPSVPDIVVCFDPGRGRPFAGNPDPRPSYSFLAFSASSGEFMFTGHMIRGDLYSGQPCGTDAYTFIARTGYWECVHQ